MMAAIVADCMVRDAAGIGKLSIPVFSRGVTARTPAAIEPIALDVPVVCAGAQVRPNDILVGGLDGLLVLPPARVDDILFELDDLEKIEEELQRLIAGGASASTIEPVLKRKKVPRKKGA
jgi:regulator of RNase E activity RraA